MVFIHHILINRLRFEVFDRKIVRELDTILDFPAPIIESLKVYDEYTRWFLDRESFFGITFDAFTYTAAAIIAFVLVITDEVLRRTKIVETLFETVIT